ncbi:hypothetical protein CesoFtcFv8_003928 [Champsocephalus esox]|nr:hypothetical protein CesoFtcFv8_003928 [Champsocephalus esox]
MSGELKGAKEQTDYLKKWTEQLNSLAQNHADCSLELRTQLQDKMLEAESRLAVRLQALEVRVEQFEAQQDQADHLKTL